MNIETINNSIQPQKDLLLQHSLYKKVKTIEDLQLFSRKPCLCGLGFHVLIKSLTRQINLHNNPLVRHQKTQKRRYLINEIVLAEETDLTIDGRRQSHFEMYIEAMEDCGADTSGIQHFLSELNSLHNIFVAIKQSNLHPNLKAFLDFTFRVIDEGKSHEIAAAFTFGREDLIPSMFTEILKNFQANFPKTDLSKLIYYFERHIVLDADEHGPMAMKMITELCGTDPQKWAEVEEISVLALEKRIGLWDAIEEQIMIKMEMA